ncbi:MAG: methyl-accepting chemotaxis protein [Leptonema sp. (in: bacteria)]
MKSKIEQDILKSDYSVLSYVYIRYFFIIFYGLIFILESFEMKFKEILPFGFGLFIYLISGFYFHYLVKKKKKYKWRDIIMILFDVTIIFFIYSYFASQSIFLASFLWKNIIFFMIPLFILVGMSFFDFSRKFITFTNLYINLWILVLLYISYQVGLNFSLQREDAIRPESAYLIIPFFLIGFYTFFSFLVYRLKTLFKTYFFGLQNREKKEREYLAKLKWFFHDIKITSETLNENVNSLKIFIEKFNKEMQEEASSIEEISAATEELSSTTQQASNILEKQFLEIQEIQNNNKKLTESIQNFKNSFQSLSEEIQRTEKDSIEVQNAFTKLNRIMEEIQNSFNEILEITEMINEISDRTNLLSLNASIEAARAGEYGRGFAIVAQEINRLAESSQESANNINTIIKGNANSIQKAMESMNITKVQLNSQLKQILKIVNFFNQFQKIYSEQIELNQILVNSLNNIFYLSKEVDQISKEQLQNTDSVSKTIISMEKNILELSNMSRQSLESIKQISNLSSQLKELEKKYQ